MDEDYKKLLEKNQNLVFMLGMSMAINMQLKHHISEITMPNYKWLLQAIENVVYRNEPIPPLP